jgi:amino acid transporter
MTSLRPTLGLWQVSISGIGIILGAGVYALVGPAPGLAGNALWAAFLLAALATGLTAYSYARLGALRPKDSPEFQYTALAFGPRIGFVAGWLMLIADLLAVSAVALTRVAALTDAAVLMSFLLVNLSLPWVIRRGLAGPGVAGRGLDFVLPVLALLMCGWLLVHTGWPSLATATALALVGLLIGRERPNQGVGALAQAPALTGPKDS